MYKKIVFDCWVCVFALLFVVCFSGCGDGSRRVEPVSGKVSLNGKPLADAQISFHPKNPDGFVAVGTTQSDGMFTLVTPGTTKSGAVVGEYHVAITKIVAVDDNGQPLTPETTSEDITKGIIIPKRISVLPDKYGQPDKSPLEANVVRGKNSFQFDLDDKE
jgi:hypothetical protein